MDRPTISNWFPDRRPTWPEASTIGVVTVWLLLDFRPIDAISWWLVTLGFLATTLAIGPLAATWIGDTVREWADALDFLGRLFAILLFAVAVFIGSLFLDVPEAALSSFVGGVMVAAGVYVVVHVLLAGGVEGWTMTEE